MAERTCAACDCKLEGEPIQVRIGGKAVEVCCEDCALKLREAQASTGDSRSSSARGRALAVLALCLAAAIGGAQAVRAETPESVGKSVRISYSDLDLETTAGVEKLYERIEQAARRVCEQHGVRLSATTQRRFNKCVDASMSTAARSVGNATLLSMLASGTPTASYWPCSRRRCASASQSPMLALPAP
jgi:UrcA family protein